MYSQWTNRSAPFISQLQSLSSEELGVECHVQRHLSSSFSKGRRESCSFVFHHLQTNVSSTSSSFSSSSSSFLPPPPYTSFSPPSHSLSSLWVNSQLTLFVMATNQSWWLGLQLTLPVCVVVCVCEATHAQCVRACVCRQQLAAWACQPGLESNTLQRCLLSFFLSFFFMFLSFFLPSLLSL